MSNSMQEVDELKLLIVIESLRSSFFALFSDSANSS